MELVQQIVQVIIALGIINVWFFRFGKSTRYRGGNAQNLKEEFKVYGLPQWLMILVGVLKLGFAVMLLFGLWYPHLTEPAAIGMAILMVGAVYMHFKVGDSLEKSVPAIAMLVMSLFVAYV